jgi:hypothetical protein
MTALMYDDADTESSSRRLTGALPRPSEGELRLNVEGGRQ